jgi:hypothetical protein
MCTCVCVACVCDVKYGVKERERESARERMRRSSRDVCRGQRRGLSGCLSLTACLSPCDLSRVSPSNLSLSLSPRTHTRIHTYVLREWSTGLHGSSKLVLCKCACMCVLRVCVEQKRESERVQERERE